MKTAPSVTCIMIFLDGAAFIDEAIRSVVAQGDEIAWELVLVDDGSTDDSTAIARRWARSDPRIRYVEHDGHANLGMSASRNAGLAVSTGTYVGFLDCDDIWLPSALSHGLSVLANHPEADAVFGGAWRWHSWTDDPADRLVDHQMPLPDRVTHEVIEPPDLFADIYREPDGFRMPAICGLLIDRSSLLRVGGFDDSFRHLYEDQVLYAKIAFQLRVVVDPRPMALYRQHHASACRVAIEAGEWEWNGPSEPRSRFVEWLQTYIAEHAGGDVALLDVVRRNVDWSERSTAFPLPSEAPEPLRRRFPEPVRRIARTIRNRMRPRVPATTVAEHWSEQFFASRVGPIDGSTLVVVAPGDGRPWAGVPPAEALAERSTTCSWNHAATIATRYERVVVPLAVASAVDTSVLVAGVGRRLAKTGTAYLLVPGPALDHARPGADQVVAMIRGALPTHRVVIESFGNAATVADLDAVATDLGLLIDRHDATVPAVFGIAITPESFVA